MIHARQSISIRHSLHHSHSPRRRKLNDTAAIEAVALLLCQDWDSHATKYSSPITDAEFYELEGERAVNGGYCNECRSCAVTIARAIREVQ